MKKRMTAQRITVVLALLCLLTQCLAACTPSHDPQESTGNTTQAQTPTETDTDNADGEPHETADSDTQAADTAALTTEKVISVIVSDQPADAEHLI